jgi:hypothetical protein
MAPIACFFVFHSVSENRSSVAVIMSRTCHISMKRRMRRKRDSHRVTTSKTGIKGGSAGKTAVQVALYLRTTLLDPENLEMTCAQRRVMVPMWSTEREGARRV